MSGIGENIIVEVKTNRKKYKVGEPVRMILKITNNGAVPVELVFNSAQRYDFIVFKNGEEVWRWSRSRMFAMVLGSMVLKPGEPHRYVETWKPTGHTPGKYMVVGIIVSKPPFKTVCEFEISNTYQI